RHVSSSCRSGGTVSGGRLWVGGSGRIRVTVTYPYNGHGSGNVPGITSAPLQPTSCDARGPLRSHCEVDVSTRTVNGPSLVECTCIIAPNAPVATSRPRS